MQPTNRVGRVGKHGFTEEHLAEDPVHDGVPHEGRVWFTVVSGEVAWRVTREPVYPRWGWWFWPPPQAEEQTIASGETGLDAEGHLMVLTVNGRIRESVGATHIEMAEILREQGAVSAMGFDPGGSSTLVVGGEQINISPYNHAYESNVFALPPEPRPVANIVIGY